MIHMQRRLGEYESFHFSSLFQRQWHPFPKAQINTLTVLAQGILNRYKTIESENVVGHSDVAPQRKVDPGPLFPWKELAERGVGVWYDRDTDRVYSDKPQRISVPWMQKSLERWGYLTPQTGKLDPKTEKVVQAFQMHFRPANHNGIIDAESSEILDLLLCQKINQSISNTK